MKDKKNPPDPHAKKGAELDERTDKFSKDEQDKIVRMIKLDIAADINSMQGWINQRKKDLQMYNGERPSVIENLNKEDWMSDRNMGLIAANCDAYQATLLATCYNIDTINFKPTEENDIDHSENLIIFTKWGLGKKEANFFPEVDDFIHNKVTQGISYFYIHWKVWYEWVDRRIPKYNAQGEFVKYEIKTEKKRFEKGVIENIDNVEDLLFPAHGDTLQKKAHLIHKVHLNAKEILDLSKRGIFYPVDDEYFLKLRKYVYDNRIDVLGKEKAVQLGITREEDLAEDDLRLFPIDVYNWYGKYKKNGKEEEWRFTIEPETNKFLAGKPLRKITRSGKRPFVGSPFIRRPGFVRGNSLPHLIEDPVNAFNNTWNQKSDFQYVENCPFFWFEPTEGNRAQDHKIKPGTGIPSVDPNSVNMPNLSRSLAWAESDFKICLEIIERLTGAASYFMSNTKGVSGTATRDAIINEKSETRFGLWVKRIIDDICEAVTMWVELYQDWAPDTLGDRLLGENGKKLFPNFSIETIRGGYDAKLSPDIISGSKTLEKEIALWALEANQANPWLDPSVNPKGNWNLWVDANKKVGMSGIENWMPPEPKAQFGETKTVKDKWTQIKQGEIPEINETDNILELYMGFQELASRERDKLDPEYRPNLDVFMFRLNIMMFKEIKRRNEERQANQMAMELIRNVEEGRLKKKDVVNA